MKTKNKNYNSWHDSPGGKIIIGVIVGLIVLFVGIVINKFVTTESLPHNTQRLTQPSHGILQTPPPKYHTAEAPVLTTASKTQQNNAANSAISLDQKDGTTAGTIINTNTVKIVPQKKEQINSTKNIKTKLATRSNERPQDTRVGHPDAVELNSIRLSLRPKVFFSKFDFTFDQNEVQLEHEIKNNGSNEVMIEKPVIQLSLGSSDKAASNTSLVENRDYVFTAVRPGKYLPGMSYRVAYAIKILSPTLLGQKLYYSLQWETETDPLAVAIISPILEKHMNATEINKLTKFSQILCGSITFSKQ